jgi:hypothetical protein
LYYEGSRIERCTVHTAGGIGLYATSISSCTVRKTGATAISVSSDPDSGSVTDCFAETVSPTGHAIYAPDGTVSNSRGISIGGFGIWAETASNCYGSSGSDTGLVATVANNCRGVSASGVGIGATTVTGSYAQSTSGSFAISATLVTGCVAKRDGGVAISANTVNGCHLMSGTLVATNKYNMP